MLHRMTFRNFSSTRTHGLGLRMRSAFFIGCSTAIAATEVGVMMPPAAYAAANKDHSWSVDDPRTEDLVNPLGIDNPTPELAWFVSSTRNGARQTAYEIQVASSATKLRSNTPDVWSSGQTRSDVTWIHYRGPTLASSQKYYWRVRVWDDRDHASAWSDIARWETGLMASADWSRAQWIRVAKLPETNGAYKGHILRKDFVLPRDVRWARLYVSATGWVRNCKPSPMPQACRTAAGIVTPSINGKRASDRQLDPAPSDSKRALYSTMDVSDLLKKGENTLGLSIAGDSDVIALLLVEDSRGQKTMVTTDRSWASHSSPTLFADRFAGVKYDAREALPDWDRPGSRGAGDWQAVEPSNDRVGPIILSSDSSLPPMRVVRTLKPASVEETKPGSFTIDFGVNISGRVKLKMVGLDAGDEVRIVHAERLNDAKEADAKSTGFAATQTDTFTSDGHDIEWSPEFAYYGFRYATITGLKRKPTETEVWAEQVNTDLARTGELDTSNDLVNSIHRGSVQTTLNNAHGIPEDCPHREKRGWSADAYVSSPQALANFDMEGFYKKFLQDVQDGQAQNGSIPDVAPPEIAYAKSDGDSVWGMVGTQLPMDLYNQTGDLTVLQTAYPSMRAYVDWVTSISQDMVIKPGKYRADWLSVKKTYDPLLRTGFWYLAITQLAEAARLLGKDGDVAKYTELADRVRNAFNERFLDRATGLYGDTGRQGETTTQLSQALPIATGLVPDDMKEKVSAKFVELIQIVGKNHPDSGLNGLRYVLEAIDEIRRPDILDAMANQTTSPSWGYMVLNGPGTLWEGWDMRGSLQHTWSGVVDAHFYRTYLGIRSKAPGYKAVTIQPYFPATMAWARGSQLTPFGKISSSWTRTPKGIRLSVAVPVGIKAEIIIPAGTSPVLVNGKSRPPSTKGGTGAALNDDGGTRNYHVQSGKYEFLF